MIASPGSLKVGTKSVSVNDVDWGNFRFGNDQWALIKGKCLETNKRFYGT